MSKWTNDELDKVGNADELTLAALRDDGTLRLPVTMWVVRDGDDVYVRSVSGRGSSWFRGAVDRYQAGIRADGVEKGVSLTGTADVDEIVDAADRAKYGRRYPTVVPSIVAQDARAATLKLIPR